LTYRCSHSDLSENSWFSLRIMQALQRSKLYVTLHPFGCCSTINLFPLCLHRETSLLPYLLLSHCSVFKVQIAVRPPSAASRPPAKKDPVPLRNRLETGIAIKTERTPGNAPASEKASGFPPSCPIPRTDPPRIIPARQTGNDSIRDRRSETRVLAVPPKRKNT